MSEALMDLSNVEMAALMPMSMGLDPNVRAVLAATDIFWHQIAAAIPTLGVLATIDQQPEEVVDRLAYDFHVDYYDADWPVERKRDIVINSIRLHRIAGTRGAVDDLIASIWGDRASVSEWWEYGGEPGTFTIFVNETMSESDIARFVASIRAVKRATDHVTMSTSRDVGTCEPHAALVVQVFRSIAL